MLLCSLTPLIKRFQQLNILRNFYCELRGKQPLYLEINHPKTTVHEESPRWASGQATGKKGFQDTSGLLSCHAEGRYETEESERQSVTMSLASDCTSFPSEHCHLTQVRDGMKEREAHGLLITAPPVDAQQWAATLGCGSLDTQWP